MFTHVKKNQADNQSKKGIKKLKVELAIEMGKDDLGFVVIPTSNTDVLQSRYGVSVTDVHTLGCSWNCTNGVTLVAKGLTEEEKQSQMNITQIRSKL